MAGIIISGFSMPLTILLAEDDDGHAVLIRRNLARAGLDNDIVRVTDGQEALDYLYRQGAYTDRPAEQNLLLLLDVNMPRVGGFDVLRQVKTDPLVARVPVIMLTTTDDPREIARGYELGCGVYITKPVHYESFVDAIHRLGLFLGIIQVPPPAAVEPGSPAS
ncbi:MAG: response regulator [Bacteroidales bacterium]|nr:response regulator [Bacteroidales bacterium]